ncbi:hypothetical protein [Tateyamaria sp. SN3-11]|uniref:hypothetical protein n=1 Tax=Tateyamaria sp. SN3-11 TaxID=3092147 RepID=UPI0039ED2BEC
MAWVDSVGNTLAGQEKRPADFDVVDLGRWITNDEGNSVLGYGGALYKVTPSNKPRRDSVWCIHPDDLEGWVQLLDGKPVPLVKSYRDGDLLLQYIQKPYGDFVHEVVAGKISPTIPKGSSVAPIEDRNRRDFANWLHGANDRGQAVSSGPNFTCMFDPKNPTLSGNSSYACLATIAGAPFSDTFIRCGGWLGGCSAEFSLTQEISIRLVGGHLHRSGGAVLIESIPETIEFGQYWYEPASTISK